jgi:hypothetical protein
VRHPEPVVLAPLQPHHRLGQWQPQRRPTLEYRLGDAVRVELDPDVVEQRRQRQPGRGEDPVVGLVVGAAVDDELVAFGQHSEHTADTKNIDPPL